MATRKDQVYVASESGHTEVDGKQYVFHKGITRVRGGHPLSAIRGFENIFEPVDEGVHYDVEQATAAPGEKRGGRQPSVADPAPGEHPEASGLSAAQAEKEAGPTSEKVKGK